MKKSFLSPVHFAVLVCVLLILISCKKDPTKPCCEGESARTKWLLTSMMSQLHKGPGDWDIEVFRFEYNAKDQPVVCMKMDYIDPALPPWRIDSLFYDDQDRLVQINSKDLLGSNSHKKIFVYSSGSEKKYSLKYRIGNDQQYHLADSTIYVYQNSAINKITYHLLNGTTDTSAFVYDDRGNLTSAMLGNFDPTVHLLGSYDSMVNATKYLGVPAIELDPYGGGNWKSEFWILMQAPVFPENNYRLRINGPNRYEYDIEYSGIDTTVAEIYTYRAERDAFSYQNFEYRTRN